MQPLSILESLAGLGSFLSYFTASLLLLLLFCLIYGKVTPYPELQLIREGKVAPAVSFLGALFGFITPLASAISHSVSFADMVIWAMIALIVQIAVFLLIRVLFRDLCRKISEDTLSAAILLGGVSYAAGTLNAACMTY
jgi:putative membrane protein